MKKFEYKSFLVVNNGSNQPIGIEYNGERLNYDQYYHSLLVILGNEGWELVTVNSKAISFVEHSGEFPYTITYTAEEEYLFKRELTKGIDLNQTGYTNIYNHLVEIDRVFNSRKELSLRTEEELSKEEIIKKYIDAGYIMIFEHKNRIEFERNLTKLRFDRTKESDNWVKKTINY